MVLALAIVVAACGGRPRRRRGPRRRRPPGAYALNLVERFATPEAAQDRLSATVRDLGNTKGHFAVPGVPGAIGFESGSGTKRGRSVAFGKGETVFLLSHQVATRTPSVGQLKAAVREWYASIPG